MSTRIAILISGRGSNMVALADAIQNGTIPNTEIALVISDQPDAKGLHAARERSLKTLVIERRGRKREEHDREIVSVLREERVDLVCLAGYMRVLSPFFVNSFAERILNIHPSLLPLFPGLDAQRQALDHGAKVSGCTVHFVDEGLDAGPIVMQSAVPVFDDDSVESLSARILVEEHRIYSKALEIVLSGAYRIEGRRVRLS